MDIKKVLDAYRKGDEDKRLSLFLGFRELRDEFARIELDSCGERSLTGRCPKWMKWIAGFL